VLAFLRMPAILHYSGEACGTQKAWGDKQMRKFEEIVQLFLDN
jgi:hypothetical protein